jgi:hypothetical protein
MAMVKQKFQNPNFWVGGTPDALDTQEAARVHNP